MTGIIILIIAVVCCFAGYCVGKSKVSRGKCPVCGNIVCVYPIQPHKEKEKWNVEDNQLVR